VIVVPLSDRGAAAIRDALLSHGWEGDLSRLTAGGTIAAAFHATAVPAAVIEAMVPLGVRLGLEIISGDDWLIVAGARSKLGAFARPWLQPAAVRELAESIGLAMPGEQPARSWRHVGGVLSLDGPVIVGILNVTPDSFSDGGRTFAPDDAVAHAAHLIEGGAQVIDVGGQSTRPDATPVDDAEECRRVLPVIEAVARRHPSVPLSIDTVHGATARRAIDAGAVIINDVTMGRHDPDLLAVAAGSGAGLVLAHSRGPLERIASYDEADYDGDVTGAVTRELAGALAAVVRAGVATESVVLDPGFGFGKRPSQNFTLLMQLDAVVGLGRPVLAGLSRKRFLGAASGRPVDDRDRATAAACALAFDRGARLFRVHEPAAVRDALAVAAAGADAGR
jgi:dihydropteroate synthase